MNVLYRLYVPPGIIIVFHRIRRSNNFLLLITQLPQDFLLFRLYLHLASKEIKYFAIRLFSVKGYYIICALTYIMVAYNILMILSCI